MKNTLTLIPLSLLLTACGHSDTKLSHQIVGVWQSGGTKLTFNPDGGFINRQVDDRSTNEYAGTWQISDGFLHMTLTNASGAHPDGRVGDTVSLRVIAADKHRLSFTIGGYTNILSR